MEMTGKIASELEDRSIGIIKSGQPRERNLKKKKNKWSPRDLYENVDWNVKQMCNGDARKTGKDWGFKKYLKK